MRTGRFLLGNQSPYLTSPTQLSARAFTRNISLTLLLSGLVSCSTQESPAVPPPAEPAKPVAAEAPAPTLTPMATVAPAPDFTTCLPQLQEKALTHGISIATVDNVLGAVTYVSRAIDLDRKQPEFSETFHHYLKQRVTRQRIEQGRKLLAKHSALFKKIEREQGVPAQYLLAFWGLESNFGSYMGTMPVLDSLATLACDQRRSEFFTAELMDALRLVDDNIVAPKAFVGSWAGAVGNMQFMPSTYRRYAMDADGSGKPDLWRSLPDALTSAANYLRQIGWHPHERWGREVKLPAQFDYAQASLQQRKTLRDWAALNVTLPNGDRLPPLDMSAAILVPSGHTGPAFLVYDNFDVILKWNRSEFYAIAVGHLADRIKGEGELHRMPPHLPRLRVEQIKALQTALNTAGFEAGVADGVLGSGTRKALRAWQVNKGMIADGYPSAEVFRALKLTERPSASE